ncbi:NB-ARC domains-containing protein [Tanacetum coccineum]
MSTVALNWLTEIWVGSCGPHDVAGENCRGMNPLRAYPDYFSPAICRRGILSPGICRRGKQAYVPEDSGEDIRKSLVDHLFNDFNQKGIYVFKDDNELTKGEEISPHLYKAIEEYPGF